MKLCDEAPHIESIPTASSLVGTVCMTVDGRYREARQHVAFRLFRDTYRVIDEILYSFLILTFLTT